MAGFRTLARAIAQSGVSVQSLAFVVSRPMPELLYCSLAKNCRSAHGPNRTRVPVEEGAVWQLRFVLQAAYHSLVVTCVGVLVAGRPVGLLVMPDGSMLVSGDQEGAIYRITYEG